MNREGTHNGKTKSNKFEMCFLLNTIGHIDFESQIKIVAKAGWKAVGIPMNNLEGYFARGKTIKDANTLLENHGICAGEIIGFRDWIYKRGKAQEEMFALFRRYNAISKKLKNPVILASTLCQGSFDDSLAKENFKEICRIAAEDENEVGLEFLPYSPVDTVKKAWSIVKAVDVTNGGIIFDFFHYFKARPLLSDLEEIPIEKIYDIHINDLKDCNPETDLTILSRNYRVLPGEGDFVFDEILEHFFESGYSRYYSLEVLNKDYPSEDPLKLAYRAKRSLEGLLKCKS